MGAFYTENSDRLSVILPADHPVLPWTALIFGLWIPNFYYWGLNQYITQRTLAAKTLRQGQLGIIFAAGLKLLIPFIVVFPGIIAFQLYGDRLPTADAAYPYLIRNLIPNGLRGFIFAAIAGAVISSLASMLNSASTIFTLDLFKRHLHRKETEINTVKIGRVTTVILVIVGCIIAPYLGHPRFAGIFNYIQEFQGFVSPGVLAAFVFGIAFKRTPMFAGVTALLLSPLFYGFLLLFFNEIAFLNRMAITFIGITLIMGILTILWPLSKPVDMPVRKDYDMRPTKSVLWLGVSIILITISLYIIFW